MIPLHDAQSTRARSQSANRGEFAAKSISVTLRANLASSADDHPLMPTMCDMRNDADWASRSAMSLRSHSAPHINSSCTTQQRKESGGKSER